MRVIFLGTNGWYNTKIANTVSVLIQASKFHIIFDAGDGLHKLDKFIQDKKPIYIFISHFHLDHISGFHILNKFNFTQGIKVCGQKGTKEHLGNIFCSPYSVDLNKLPYSLEFVELEPGRYNLGFNVEALSLLHSVDCLGYRIEIDNRIIAYCSDTGLCDNAFTLAQDADLLMAECSLKSGQDNQVWPHLNPHTAAKIAKEAGAKRLALIHFNPFLFPLLKDRRIAEKEARDIFRDSFSARDDLELELK